MENQRRRFEKEREEAFEFGGFAFAKESLALIDNLERARTSFTENKKFKENKDFPKILEAFEILEKDLISIFKRNNVEQIICKNKKFDPNFHQAMLEIDDISKEPGAVVQEIQKGYTMKDRLLRPSLVGVTRFKNEDIKKDQENNGNHDTKK
jgi:molecular chaperone GrpE